MISNELLETVLELAESSSGTVMLLFEPGMARQTSHIQVPYSVHKRYSDVQSSLYGLPVDTLIIVGKDHESTGIIAALERTQASLDPVVYLRSDDHTTDYNLVGSEDINQYYRGFIRHHA